MKTIFTTTRIKRMLFICASILLAENAITYSSGPPAGYTNAPGNSNCTGCHSGSSISSGSTWNNISLTRAGGLSNVLPNASNAMTLSFSSPTSTKFGFQLCVLPSSASSSSASVGTFSVGTSTEVQTTTSSSPSRMYLMHTGSGNSASSGSKSWSFNWQTPSGFTGGATFYVAINETDGDNSSAGDNIYVKTFSTTVLPVRWLDFYANDRNGNWQLNWSTAQEINNQRFEIERSEDGEAFIKIGTLKGKGNSETNSYYTFEDESRLTTKTFYRIKQIDFDGLSDYSKIISVEPNLIAEPKVLTDGSTQIIRFNNEKELHEVRVWGLNGQLLQSYSSIQEESLKLNPLPNGLYLLEIKSTSGTSWMKKILVQ